MLVTLNHNGPGQDISRMNTFLAQTPALYGKHSASKPRVCSPLHLHHHNMLTSNPRPVQNLSDPSLPYTGCIMALLPPETGFPSAGEKDNGSCTSVLTPDCVNEILTNIQQSAQAIYLTTTGSAESYTCPQLMDTVGDSKDSKCYQQWGGSVSSRFLTNNFTGPTYPYCLNPTNPGQSNAENQSFFSWGTGSTKGLTNYSNYDPTIRIPQPLIVATWLKAVTNSNTVDQPAQGNWADTRLLCIPGNVTTPGSRNITEADKAAGAAKIGSLNSQMAFVVALTVGLGLIL